MGELAHLQHRDPLERHRTGGDAGRGGGGGGGGTGRGSSIRGRRGGDRLAGEEQWPPKGLNAQPTKGEVRAARAGSGINTTLMDLRCQV
jgi:hypothetical protein